MTKLTILATLLAALLAVSTASIYRATTITISEENPIGGQSCQEQLQKQWQQLRHCTTYLSQQRSGGKGEPYAASLRMVTKPGKQEHLQQCCEQLRNMDEQCRCEAIKQIVRQQQQEGEIRGERMQEVVEKAMYLPSTCNIRPQECQIRAVWF